MGKLVASSVLSIIQFSVTRGKGWLLRFTRWLFPTCCCYLPPLFTLHFTYQTGQYFRRTLSQPRFSGELYCPHFSIVWSSCSTLHLPELFTLPFTDMTGQPFRTTLLQPPLQSTISTNLGLLFLNISFPSLI